MIRHASGHYDTTAAGGEIVRAFVPFPLPPDPPLDLSGNRQRLLERATLALGRLDSVSTLLPDPQLFLYAYVRREAVLSSQMEGTQSSLSDLLLFELEEAPGTPMDDVVEVSNYIRALEHGMARLRDGFPLCNRLLREMHSHLMSRGRGSDKEPGEFRRTQNWIGGTRPGNARFVPPPPHMLEPCMAALEAYLHEDTSGTPVLLKAALAHVQFETIHPLPLPQPLRQIMIVHRHRQILLRPPLPPHMPVKIPHHLNRRRQDQRIHTRRFNAVATFAISSLNAPASLGSLGQLR
jgi:hypothetical protein